MKKIIAITSVLAIVLLCSFSANKSFLLGKYGSMDSRKLNAEGMNLKDDVRFVKTSCYYAKASAEGAVKDNRTSIVDENSIVDCKPVVEMSFDKNGNLVTMSEYDANLNSTMEKAYIWQGGGVLKEEWTHMIFGEGDDYIYKTVYRYDGNRIKEELQFDGNNISGNIVWDENCKMKTVYTTDASGLVYGFVSYNKNGNVVSSAVNFVEDGEVVQSVVRGYYGVTTNEYKYQNGDLVEAMTIVKNTKKEGNLNQATGSLRKYTFNNGNLVSLNVGFSSMQTSNLKEDVYVSDNDLIRVAGMYKTNYSYNEYGDMISAKESNGEMTFTYEYDSHHNWTRKVTYKKGEPLYVQEREIKYFY